MTMEWMAWTPVTAGFFISIGLILVGMGVWQAISPTTERRGILPIKTTRGDRLFIGLLGSGYITIAWIGLTSISLWFVLPVLIIFIALVIRYG
jgi:predicted small integral membrane protein